MKTLGRENLLGKQKQAFCGIVLLAFACLGAMGMSGCPNAYGTAAKLADDIATVDNSGAQTINGLYTSGVITADEERSALGVVSSISTLNDTYINCGIAAHNAGGRAAAFIGCAQIFATALESPDFLSSVHIKDANSQAKVQAIASAADSAVQVAIIGLQNLAAKGK